MAKPLRRAILDFLALIGCLGLTLFYFLCAAAAR